MPTINDRIGSQNVIRVLSNASAPPSRVNNLLDINAGRKDDIDSTGLLLIWDKTAAQYVLGNDIAHGLNITGLTTFTRLEATGVTFSGVTTAATLSATTALSMGSTSVISAARQLQNIASLDATTTATIESAIVNAPNTFNDLQITGVSTFIGKSGHVGLATFGGGIDVVAGVTTFREDIQFKGAAYDILWDQATSKFKFNDSAQAVFGSASGGDLKIYHQSGNSTIKNETGQFRIASNDLRLQSQDSSEDYLLAVDGGSVSLFFNDVKRLETSSSGVNITDTLNVSGVSTFVGVSTFSGDVYIGGDLYLKDDLVLDNITGSSLNITGISTFAGAIDGNAGADISGGETVLSSATVSDLTSGRITYAGASGALQDSANLTFTGTNLTVTGLADIVGHTELDNLNVSGVSTFQNDVQLLDNDILLIGGTVGTHDGLKIYHEGNHSYITDSGTGHLKIQGSTQVAIENIAENKTMAVFNSAGSSELYWRGASGEGKKIETTQTGSIVTGILTATQFVGLVDGGSY